MENTIIESKNNMSLIIKDPINRPILIADDDKCTQDVVSKFLKIKGFDVTTAECGTEALSLFIIRPFDMVLTDLHMPEMDGLSLATHIKKRSPETPIVLLTGDHKEAVLKKVESGPFYSVLFKPFRLVDLHRTIQGALSM